MPEKAINLGVDGIIVSNHGGRQLDVGQSTIKPLTALAKEFGDRTTLMLDSGVRNGRMWLTLLQVARISRSWDAPSCMALVR